MRKLICFVLTIVLCLASLGGAYANSENESSQNSVTIELDGDGQYVDSSSVKGNHSEQYVAEQTEDMDIYSLKDGTLLSKTGLGSYQAVDRMELSLSDRKAVKELLSNPTINDNMKEEISSGSENAILNNNKTATAVIFVPKGGDRASTISDPYYYKSHKLYDEIVYFYDKKTGWKDIAEGKKAWKVAKEYSTGTICDNVAGALDKFNLFSNAKTALDIYYDITGTRPINGASDDYWQGNLQYDIYTKWTYADLGYGDGYRLGCRTQKVKVQTFWSEQYYFGYYGGKTVETTTKINKTFRSPNYKSPAKIACLSVNNPWVEDVYYKINKHPVYF